MFLAKRHIWAVFALFLFIIYCGDPKNETDTGQSSESGAGSGYTVYLLDQPGFQQLIGQRNGRILFINVWATWCIPCREEFPDLVQLAEKYQDRKVDIVAISADYPDEIDSKIIPFLQSQQINFPVYVQNFDAQEDFINFLNLNWSGALPASFIYNANGEQKLFLLGKQNYEAFAAAIEKEL